jgi:hypothetical protein
MGGSDGKSGPIHPWPDKQVPSLQQAKNPQPGLKAGGEMSDL